MMFHYTICNQFDTSVFKRQCLAIENHKNPDLHTGHKNIAVTGQ